MKYTIRNGKTVTEKEYISYLEGLAEGIWLTGEELANGGECYGKMSDPLYISGDLNDVYSYVFDFHDGGRHHAFKSLEDLYLGLRKEIDNYKALAQEE